MGNLANPSPSPSSPPPARARRASRRWLVLAALAVVLLLAGLFAYSRLTAGIGHHLGDTITHTMPGGGTVSFTLRTVTPLQQVSAPPSMRSYDALVLVVNHTPGQLNITSAEFASGPAVTDSNPYPPAPSCFQEVPPGDNLTCDLTFTLPQTISHPVLYWLPDGAGNTSNIWWYLTS